jgi:23S rRNA (guanosine2251-2'-O)-methyltransferase
MPQIVLIVHNIRSSHNVGSLLRTAEGLGVDKVYLTGYSPYPKQKNDPRLPHFADKQSRQIAKTSLGAESSVAWQHEKNISRLIAGLKKTGFQIIVLEQTNSARPIGDFAASGKVALVVGNEVEGVDDQTLKLSDDHLYIPMAGRKESFNVSIAAAIALYHLKLRGDGQID